AYRVPAAPMDPIVVSRPEPLHEEVDTPDGEANAKLSHEEIVALLAVHTANAPRRWETAGTRFKLLFLPTGVISLLLSLVLGTWGLFVPIVIAVVIALAPLLRQKRDGWS
ncbi:MAG: hypothetical protein ABI551_24045, partial [Polyangiaceae bacterium]